MLTVEQAWDEIVRHVEPATPERVPLPQAAGLVLAEDLVSTIDSPPFDKSMMDGFAVRQSDLAQIPVSLPVSGEVAAGQPAAIPLAPGTVFRIMTGAPIPKGAELVIPREWTIESHETVTFQKGSDARPGWNILRQGESMAAGDLLLRGGDRITPAAVALLAETGQAFPLVRTPPVVGILATGDELVEISQTPGAGQIRNTNAVMLAAQVQTAGGIPRNLGIARDNQDSLREHLPRGLECDFLCLSGGVSAGDYDLVPSELKRAGVAEVFHKVAMKPGKPCWFGVGTPRNGRRGPIVFGLPGNPVSSMVCFELFVRLALRRWMEGPVLRPNLLTVTLAAPFRHRSDRPTWFPAHVTTEDGTLTARPAPWKGSADLRGTATANCSLSVPAGEVTWSPGERVTILPWGCRDS